MRQDVDAALSRCLEAAAEPELWPEALGLVSSSLGCRGALITRPARNHSGILYSPTMDDAIGLFFEEDWHLRDYRTDHCVARGPERITYDQDIIQADEINRSDYYRGFAQRADVAWFACLGVGLPDGGMVGISFQRRYGEGVFEVEDQERIEAYAPRMRQALVLADATCEARDTGLLSGLELVDQAALLLGDHGRLLAANRAAEAVLGAHTGIRRTARSIVATHAPARQRLERFLAAACGLGPAAERASAPPLALPCVDGTLVLQAVPVVGAANDLFGAGRCLVLLSHTGRPRRLSRSLLVEAFGLTPTEGRVAGEMALGLPAKVIANTLGMSEGAVRFHVKAVLSKAGVHGKAEFVDIAARLTTLPG